MKRISCFLLLTLILVCTVSGCAPKKVVKRPQTDPALERLNEAAQNIQSELEQLSKIKQVDYESVEVYKRPQKGPLAKNITVKWSGPLEDVLRVIAARINYAFKVKGDKPASPVLVSIDQTESPAFEVIEDLGWKAGKHEVSVDAGKQIVQLTYFDHYRAAEIGDRDG
jgi:hypothetical protein